MAEFDDLNKNINNLIAELRNKDKQKEDKVDLSSLNDFAESAKGYEQYLKEIQSNTKGIRESVNAFLKNMNAIESNDDNVEETQPVMNYGIEQKAFVDYNEELKRLIDKITDISLQLKDASSKVTVDVDFKILDDISEKIKQANLNALSDLDTITSDIKVNINSEQIESELNMLTMKLKELEAPIQLTFSSNIEDMKQILGEFSQDVAVVTELKTALDGLGSDISTIDTSQLEGFITKLSELKQIAVQVNSSNIEGLQKLQSVEVEVDAVLNIEELQSKLATFKDMDLNVVLNIEDILSKVSVVQTALGDITEKFGVIDVDAAINLTYDKKTVQSNLQEQLSATELTLKPTIEIDTEAIQQKITSYVNAVVEIPANVIDIKPSITETNVVDHMATSISEEDTKLQSILEANTEAIQQLQNAITLLANQKVEKAATPSETKSTGDKTKVDDKAKKSNTPASMEELMVVLIQAVNNMSSKQSQMVTELKKSIFLKNND
jgi:hypothetical protein